MANLEKLETKIRESGLKIYSVADRSGIARGTLYNRMIGRGDFKTAEISGLVKVLKLTKAEREEIFFR